MKITNLSTQIKTQIGSTSRLMAKYRFSLDLMQVVDHGYQGWPRSDRERAC